MCSAIDKVMMRQLGIGVLFLVAADHIGADTVALAVTPQKCVALNKGQICYQSLRFVFTAETSGDFCLMAGNRDTPLQCWQSQTEGEFGFRMASDEDLEFWLTDASGVRVATASVSVAWVYKRARQRNRWRLF